MYLVKAYKIHWLKTYVKQKFEPEQKGWCKDYGPHN